MLFFIFLLIVFDFISNAIFQKSLTLILAVIAVASADVSHLYDNSNGYDYPKPDRQLCPDGVVRENCDVPKQCTPPYVGQYPNCALPPCPQGKLKIKYLEFIRDFII